MTTHKQQGAAIIIALFITALIATAAIAMIEHFRVDVRRTQLILQANQSYFYAQGALAWAKNELITRLQKNPKGTNDKKNPINAATGREGPYIINSSIIDLQGLFNINNLNNSSYHPIFIRLVQNIIKLDSIKTQELTEAIVDWITIGLKNTRFDQYYLTLKPAYRAAHRPMVSISELRLVKGMTAELFSLLSPYLTALPPLTSINVNTATAPLLMSLNLNSPQEKSKIQTTLVSSYFLLKTNVTVADQQTIFYALLQRVANTQSPASTVTVIWQSKGAL